jgi:hypothetical protein
VNEQTSLYSLNKIGFHPLFIQILLVNAIFSCGLSHISLTEFVDADLFQDVFVLCQALVNPLFHNFVVHLDGIVRKFEPSRFQFLCLTSHLIIQRFP